MIEQGLRQQTNRSQNNPRRMRVPVKWVRSGWQWPTASPQRGGVPGAASLPGRLHQLALDFQTP